MMSIAMSVMAVNCTAAKQGNEGQGNEAWPCCHISTCEVSIHYVPFLCLYVTYQTIKFEALAYYRHPLILQWHYDNGHRRRPFNESFPAEQG